MKGNVKCSCGHSWNTSDSSKKDASVCHICGKDNTMKDGGWLDKYEPGGTVAKTDATRVAAPALKLTKAQLEKNKAINKQVMANTNKAKEAEVAKRTTARNKPGKTVSEVFTSKEPYEIQERFRLFPGDTEYGQVFDEYINPAYFTTQMASDLGNSLQSGDYKGAALTAGMALGAGALGFDPLGGAMKLPGKLDKAIYPTRTYRASSPVGNTSPYEVSALAEKVAGKGDWSTKDLSEAAQYVSGSEMSGGRPGLLTGQNMNLTEYKVPFWKKSVASDADVIALKASQGTVPNPNEYIIPDNKFLYPRRTNVLQQVPENVKNAKFTIGSGEQFPYYNPRSMPGSYSSDTFRSPAYKYIEDQINAVTGQQMPLTYTAEQAAANQIPMFNWKQPQIAPNKGMGEFSGMSKFSGLGDYLTTQTPLANAYKINPFAFKPTEGMMYRGIGKAGMKDALESGVFRQAGFSSGVPKYNQVWYAEGPERFAKAQYFSKDVIAEVPKSSFTQASVDKFRGAPGMQVRGTNQHIPINEGRILQKDWLRGYKPIEVPKKENGGWLEKYNDGGPIQPNYNDYSVSAPEGFQGDGYSNVGRNYSPAWGGQFAMGGSIPGSVGFMYARTNDPAPSNGKYAKKTKASAQDGTELENAYSKWPALRNMGTAAVNKDYGLGLGLGYGGVEFMHPDLKEVNYDNGVLVNQSPGKNSTTYNPLTDDAQSVRLDMLHGMHQDPTFSKHRDAFKQSVLSDPSIKGDMNHWYNEDKKKGRAGDGKDQWTNNYIDGQMRTLLFEGDRKSRNYSDEEANQLLANPKIKKSFNKLNDYLKAGYSYGQGPRANNGAEMKYYQNGLDWKPRSMDDGGEVVPGENEELQIPSAWYDKMASIKKTRLRGPGTRTRFMPPQLLDEDQFEVEDVNYDQLSAPHFVNSLTPVESKNYIPKMQDRFTDMENMYYTKNAEFNENWSNLNLLDESSNKIKLNTGRFTGAKVPTNIIDELAKTSRKQNVSLGQLLTLMGRESMFGSGTDQNEDRAGSKTSLMSGWNVAEDYQPYNNIRFLADNKVPGVKPTPTPHGYEYEITDERAMNNYLKKNPKLLDQYKAKLDSTKVLGDQDAFDLAAKFLKKKGVKGYNPGDPRYEEMFQKDYDTLKQDKALMSYLKKKGYKYEQGGQLTKLDQLTNFSNYNTKQPGGWLDKYQ